MEAQRDANVSGSGERSIARPPTVTWPADKQGPLPAHLAAMCCPNCDSTREKELVLKVEVQPPGQILHRLILLRCPDCTCLFYDNQDPPDYTDPDFNKRGRVPFYVQQGAGISLITRPLAQVNKPAGSTYMEVGCGYGFGLDFAIHTRGWKGVGIDPAPLSALGREAMQVPIELRYLRENDEAVGTMDVVMGSEVVEHVTSPRTFVQTLRAMLKPGGVLILTTPNADDIVPTMNPGVLVPLLSPTLHLVMQNPASMRRLLTEAGFAHVTVGIDSHSLVAFASDVPLDLETDTNRLRQIYREHLLRRASEVPRSSDLFIGFAGRALFEYVNAPDLAGAQQAWALLVSGCRERYGFDLDELDKLPPAAATCGLEEMARLMPINLSLILYGDAISRLLSGTPREQVERRFVLAAAAAKATRRALGELSMEDGLTEDVGWASTSEALICAAVRGSLDLTRQLRALPVAPPSAGGEVRRRETGERVLTTLVNSGHFALARKVAQAEGLMNDTTPDVPLRASTRDALYSLGGLDIQTDGNPARARKRFAFVRRSIDKAHPLFWPSLRGEIQALSNMGLRHEATALVNEVVRESQLSQSEIPEDIREKLR